MDAWRLALAVTLCVALDVATPMMPRALAFSADDSVGARRLGGEDGERAAGRRG